ncbi:MAG: alkaline phosphatase, partial [Verrucomicrobiota bacterium]|nr:alkaline phosphatase [Verrucomicrobiota bacterium]
MNAIRSKSAAWACLLVVLCVCQSALPDGPANVIFFIGDGMGFEQVRAGGMFGNGAAGTLSFESFPFQGQITTYSANSSVTDSAAAATA